MTVRYCDESVTVRTFCPAASPPWYRHAQRGNRGALIELASILLHERHHQLFGPEEVPCYDAQLRFLRRFNLPPIVIQAFEKLKERHACEEDTGETRAAG